MDDKSASLMVAFVILQFSNVPASRAGFLDRAGFVELNAKEGFSKVIPDIRLLANFTSQSSHTKNVDSIRSQLSNTAPLRSQNLKVQPLALPPSKKRQSSNRAPEKLMFENWHLTKRQLFQVLDASSPPTNRAPAAAQLSKFADSNAPSSKLRPERSTSATLFRCRNAS